MTALNLSSGRFVFRVLHRPAGSTHPLHRILIHYPYALWFIALTVNIGKEQIPAAKDSNMQDREYGLPREPLPLVLLR